MVRQSPSSQTGGGPEEAIRRNGEESVNPAPCAACGFSLLFLPQLFMSFCPFLSRLASCLARDCSLSHVPSRAACSMYLVIIRGGSAVPPYRHFSLSALLLPPG